MLFDEQDGASVAKLALRSGGAVSVSKVMVRGNPGLGPGLRAQQAQRLEFC
jgi:hypothetical protein